MQYNQYHRAASSEGGCFRGESGLAVTCLWVLFSLGFFIGCSLESQFTKICSTLNRRCSITQTNSAEGTFKALWIFSPEGHPSSKMFPNRVLFNSPSIYIALSIFYNPTDKFFIPWGWTWTSFRWSPMGFPLSLFLSYFDGTFFSSKKYLSIKNTIAKRHFLVRKKVLCYIRKTESLSFESLGAFQESSFLPKFFIILIQLLAKKKRRSGIFDVFFLTGALASLYNCIS